MKLLYDCKWNHCLWNDNKSEDENDCGLNYFRQKDENTVDKWMSLKQEQMEWLRWNDSKWNDSKWNDQKTVDKLIVEEMTVYMVTVSKMTVVDILIVGKMTVDILTGTKWLSTKWQ